ncbi:hypothetical protein FWK35_00011033 [Aphis craccivora]
MTLIY